MKINKNMNVMNDIYTVCDRILQTNECKTYGNIKKGEKQ